MRISARNVIKGTITNIEDGAVNCIVSIEVGGATLISSITMEAIRDLKLEVGMPAYAIVKASHVMFASGTEPIANLSARNQLVGQVSTIRAGAVNGRVSLELEDGNIITGSITNAAIKDLGLEVGSPAVAIMKSSDIMIGIDD